MHMRKKILQLIVILVAFCQMQTFAQEQKVTGRVVGPDNKPIAGASVTIGGTQTGTVTDEDGNFSITAPKGSSLLVTSVNFNDQVIKVDGRSVVNVSLVAGNSAGLDEVIVTGYTAQRKKDIVGAVAVVDVGALKAVPSGSAVSALQGQAAGVNVINNGSPGTTSQLTVRGITGFSNNVLVLIDGVQGDINSIPAIDVESIQVLKDASAAAIYGARGSNGVIIVTTKKGKSGAPQVVYDSYYNLQMPRSLDKLDLLNTEEWGAIYRELVPGTEVFANGGIADFTWRNNTGQKGVGNTGDPNVDPSKYSLNPKNGNNNYIIQPVMNQEGGAMYDAITRTALMMQHNVTASGGNDRANYLLSLGYIDQQGTIINTYMRRYNARINTTFKIRDNIRIGENLNLQYRNNPPGVSANGGFGPIETAINTVPMQPLYDIAGNFAGTFASANTGEGGDRGNAFADASNLYNNRNREYGINGNVFLEIDFLKHFMFKTVFGGSINNFYRQEYSPRKYWARDGASADNLSDYSGFNTLAQWTNTVQYKNEIGKHNINVLVGTEAIENKFRQLYGYGENFLLNTPEYLVLQSAAVRPRAPSNGNGNALDYVGETALASLIGRLEYQYNEKYLATFSARRDGFSSFGKDNRYGNFYSVGLGWRISSEDFMKNVGWVNDLKLRASYGELGNNQGIRTTNAYSTFALSPQYSFYDINGTNNSLVTGYYPLTSGNSKTSWETNKQFNIGFDASLFNNKIDMSVEYFVKKTEGLLRAIGTPSTAGEAVAPFINFGNIENKGVDLNLQYNARFSSDFTMNFGVNFTTYKNMIKALPDPGYFDEDRVRQEAGFPVGSWYGYKIIGIFREQKDLDESAVQQSKELGVWRYQDTDGNDTINQFDRVHLGDPNPDFTIGLNIRGNWKNFDFQATFYSAVGQDVWNGLNENLASWESVQGARGGKVRDAWSPTNPNGTWKKAQTNRNFSNSSDPNDQYIEKGSFVRLRNLQIGYTFTGAGLKRAGLGNVRVFVGGTNLFLITKYSGLDPEIYASGDRGQNGTDAGAYIQTPGIVGGLRVNF